MHHRLPVLITGLAGVSAYNLFPYLLNKYPGQVFAQRRKNHWPLSGEGILASDLEDIDELKRLFDKHQFQAVINCGGSCALKSCELDPVMAHRVNVSGIENVLNQIQGTDCRLVHLSIDLVYGGAQGGDHVETDIPDPVTVYGKTMVHAEGLVRSLNPNAAILRISLPMGISFNGHAGAIDWIQNRFKSNKPATLYYDEVRTPTYCDCLNQVIEEVVDSELSGIFHAGGPRKLSLYEIAQVVNRVGGYDPELLKGCYRIEAGPMPPRAGNVTMNSSKLASHLGRQPFQPWPYDESFVPENRNWHFDRPTDQKYSAERLANELYSLNLNV